MEGEKGNESGKVSHGESSVDSFLLAEMGNNINTILKEIGSMSKKLTVLGTRVQHMEEVLQQSQDDVGPFSPKEKVIQDMDQRDVRFNRVDSFSFAQMDKNINICLKEIKSMSKMLIVLGTHVQHMEELLQLNQDDAGQFSPEENPQEKVIQDMDQRDGESSVDSFPFAWMENNIDIILKEIKSMSNKVTVLGTYVQRMEEVLQNPQQNQDYDYDYDDAGPFSSEVKPQERSSSDPQLSIPSLPENINILSFCDWANKVDMLLKKYSITRFERVKLVTTALPSKGEVYDWWEQVQKLSTQVDEYNPILWDEMKLLLMARFLTKKKS